MDSVWSVLAGARLSCITAHTCSTCNKNVQQDWLKFHGWNRQGPKRCQTLVFRRVAGNPAGHGERLAEGESSWTTETGGDQVVQHFQMMTVNMWCQGFDSELFWVIGSVIAFGWCGFQDCFQCVDKCFFLESMPGLHGTPLAGRQI